MLGIGMKPTLQPGDKMLVVVKDHPPLERGDVIVFEALHQAGNSTMRIIGLPGETVSTRGGYVYVDGKRLFEPWLPKTQTPAPSNFACPMKTENVPAGEYYVLGDNRGDAMDSRCEGPISAARIVGVATRIVYPASRATTLLPSPGPTSVETGNAA